MDQADTLRRLMRERAGDSRQDEEGVPVHCPQVLTVASGKGGVGKSCLVANLGTRLARQGLRVLIVDGDFGLANLDLLFGVQVEATLENVLQGHAPIQDALVGIEPNLWLLPSASGLMSARGWGLPDRERLLRMLEQCPWEMDIILIDAGAGIHDSVLELHSPAYRSLLVLTPEPTSLADAYALVKCLRRSMQVSRFEVVVNQASDGREAQATFQKLKDIASRFLDVELVYLGHLSRDEKIIQSVMKRKILLDLDGECAAAKCIDLIAKRLVSSLPEKVMNETAGAGLSRFMDDPAQVVPGNSAKFFFRTLLGEVNK